MTTETDKRKASNGADLCHTETTLLAPALPKQPKIIASIIKGVCVKRKPRVGSDYQAQLPPLANSKI